MKKNRSDKEREKKLKLSNLMIQYYLQRLILIIKLMSKMEREKEC